MAKMVSRARMAAFALPVLAAIAFSAQSLAQSPADHTAALEDQFSTFTGKYSSEIQRRNGTYLQSVHPKLPEEMYDFFLDVTLDMMRYADEKAGADAKIECQDFDVCKVIFPQPNGSWAAQRFILHDGAWQWLDQ